MYFGGQMLHTFLWKFGNLKTWKLVWKFGFCQPDEVILAGKLGFIC
jgi:hypothetical protein